MSRLHSPGERMVAVDEKNKLNILVAYPYMGEAIINELSKGKDRIRFLLDSGSFTADSIGKEIKLDDYCRFIDSLPVKPWRYFSLDVIGDPEKTRRNYEIMLERGYDPIPIFTQGDEIESLEYFYSKSEIVGIGGLVVPDKKKVRAFIAKMMRHVKGRKCHWLGFTDVDFVNHFRPYMCDSSVIQSALRFGKIIMYEGKGRTKVLERKDFIRKPSPKVISKLLRYGINVRDLSKDESWRGLNSVSNRVTVGSFVEKSMDVFHNLGTRLFMAIQNATASQVRIMLDFHRKFCKESFDG